MVKVRKLYAYTYKNSKRYRHVLTVPDDVIEKLGWKDGQEVEPAIEDGTLIFRPAKRSVNRK